MEACRFRVNSSVANLGPGFDIIAACLDLFTDTVTIQSDFSYSNKIDIKGKGVPLDPSLNSAGHSIALMKDELNLEGNITITLEKRIPAGFGLGSSGASAVGAVRAMSTLYGLPLSIDEQIYYAGLGEGAVSGSPHWDNVAASTLGGVDIISSFNPFHAIQISSRSSMLYTVIMPHLNIRNKTMGSRKIIPDTISLKEHIQANSNISTLITGLIRDDLYLIRKGMNDEIVEKSRSTLYPYYDGLKKQILEKLDAGVCISGAGPSILVVSNMDSQSVINKISEEFFMNLGMEYSIYSGGIGNGASIEEEILL